MRKFIKFLAATVAGLVGFVSLAPFGKAMWRGPLSAPKPLEEVLYTGFERAEREGRPAATYCFFCPHRRGSCGVDLSMEHPRRETSLENIPVAICLQNEAAKAVFRNYFLKKKDTSLSFEEVMKNVDPRENVFVISFADLQNMAYPDPAKEPDLALFTRNGILGGGYHDADWAWREVIEKSAMLAGWDSEAMGYDLPHCFRVKIRILMRDLTGRIGVGFGKATRALYGGKMNEGFIWDRGWTGKDDFLPI